MGVTTGEGRGSTWRLAVACATVALAMGLATAPLLVHVLRERPHLSLPAVCGYVLVQVWVFRRLDRVLGRPARLPRRRLLLAMSTSTVGMTTTAVVTSLAEDLDRLRWPALIDAVVVGVVTMAGSRLPRSVTSAAEERDAVSCGEGAGGR